MTECEWLAATEPQPLLDWVRHLGWFNARKFQLFAVACCARVAHRKPFAMGDYAIVVAERFADGIATDRERWQEAEDFCPCGLYNTTYRHPAIRAAYNALYPERADQAAQFAARGCKRTERAAERASQAELLRDSFGNPFRPIVVDRACVTATVHGLAQSIYDERAFDRLPILADALEDAGCTDVDILTHCRQPGLHARGCWLIDQLLARS